MDHVHSLVDLLAQENTNHRLGRLTILSVMFMPIALLAGIGGVNFTLMPELNLPIDYPIALGSMFLVGAGK